MGASQERSRHNNVPGKRMWTTTDLEVAPKPRDPWDPAPGRIVSEGGVEMLTFYLYVEAFDRGVLPVVQSSCARIVPTSSV